MSYEDYLREVLGYTPYMQDTFNSNDYYIMQDNNCYNYNNCVSYNNDNFKDLYPDIYTKIYPLVCDECNKNTMPLTKEILEQMTDNVYSKIEIDLKIETNIGARKEDIRNSSNREHEDRVTRRDNMLRDLIKILILNKILDGGSFQNRPPFPGRPQMPGPRPPYPGGPIRPRKF